MKLLLLFHTTFIVSTIVLNSFEARKKNEMPIKRHFLVRWGRAAFFGHVFMTKILLFYLWIEHKGSG